MAHLGARAFSQISGEMVQTTAWVVGKRHQTHYQPVFFRLIEGAEEAKKTALLNQEFRFGSTQQDDFKKIPGSPITYWFSDALLNAFSSSTFGSFFQTEGQNKTTNNDKYLRFIWEVNANSIGISKKWLYCAKGGEFRKWYGNLEHVIDWSKSSRDFYRKDHSARIVDEKYWYLKGITWTDITSSSTAFRYLPPGATYETTGPTLFLNDGISEAKALAFLNSKVMAPRPLMWIL